MEFFKNSKYGSQNYAEALVFTINRIFTVMEVPPVALLPNFLVQKKALKPFRFHTGGTILAARLALEYQWAINLGGGFHHCSADKGGGFCAYADITLAIRFMQLLNLIKTAMIVDLDAHQGNGHGRDFTGDSSVYIMDMYNCQIYPFDQQAKAGIRRKVELRSGIEDAEYLQLLRDNLKQALTEFHPDLLVYNAGTDCLVGDPLGRMNITPKGIKQRDQIVWEACRIQKIPIVMLTSGGYQRNNARIIADSIKNLFENDLIDESSRTREPDD